MILRRLADAITEQNWFTVVIEFVVVVAGIFVAIQMDNWNQDRLEAKRAVEYRTRLVVDLRYDLTIMERRSVYFAGVMDFALTAESALSSEDPVFEESAWEVVLASYQAGQAWPFAIFGATYRELQSAGELDLLGGAATMTHLSEYYDNGAFQYKYAAPAPPYRDMIINTRHPPRHIGI